jgi:hypothetical protein
MSDPSHRIDNYKSAVENRKLKWARQDSNLGPRDYESPALTAELQAHAAKLTMRMAVNQDRKDSDYSDRQAQRG